MSGPYFGVHSCLFGGPVTDAAAIGLLTFGFGVTLTRTAASAKSLEFEDCDKPSNPIGKVIVGSSADEKWREEIDKQKTVICVVWGGTNGETKSKVIDKAVVEIKVEASPL